MSGALQPQGAALLGQAGKARGRQSSGWSLPKAPTAGIRTRDLRMSGKRHARDHSATVPPYLLIVFAFL